MFFCMERPPGVGVRIKRGSGTVLASIATIATFLHGLLKENSNSVVLSTEVSSYRPSYDRPETQ